MIRVPLRLGFWVICLSAALASQTVGFRLTDRTLKKAEIPEYLPSRVPNVLKLHRLLNLSKLFASGPLQWLSSPGPCFEPKPLLSGVAPKPESLNPQAPSSEA